MVREVIHAWSVNGKLTDLIEALNEAKDMASGEGCDAAEVRSDIHLVSLVRTTLEDGSSSLEVHFRA